MALIVQCEWLLYIGLRPCSAICDDLAATVLGDACAYARALAKLEDLRPFRPSLAMGAADGTLVHRIERLLDSNGRQNGPSRLLSAIVVLTERVVC